MRYDQLGDFSFRKFSGRYDLLQRPVFDDGDLLLESVMRFKGQSAPAVVLAEVDFLEFDDKALRRLFVGATRANMKLCLVISEPAARQLLARMHPHHVPSDEVPYENF
jgi:superfamily I DNA and RNA helicase